MPEAIFGLTRILVATYAGAGMPTTGLTQRFGYTVVGSTTITTEEGTTNDIFIEESETAIISQVTAGARRVAFSTYNTEPLALQAAFGGTVTGAGATEEWQAPANLAPLVVSIRIEDKNGSYVAMPKVSLTARMNISFTREDAGTVDFTGTILQPDNGTASIRRGKGVFA